MKKFVKILSMLIVATLLTVCMVAFTACGDDKKLDPNTIYITVLDENGNPIDGTTFGQHDFNPENHQVEVQFCTIDGSGACTSPNPLVGPDGKAEFDLSIIKALAETDDVIVELHILNVTAKGYVKEYDQYKISGIPQEITVTLALKKA